MTSPRLGQALPAIFASGKPPRYRVPGDRPGQRKPHGGAGGEDSPGETSDRRCEDLAPDQVARFGQRREQLVEGFGKPARLLGGHIAQLAPDPSVLIRSDPQCFGPPFGAACRVEPIRDGGGELLESVGCVGEAATFGGGGRRQQCGARCDDAARGGGPRQRTEVDRGDGGAGTGTDGRDAGKRTPGKPRRTGVTRYRRGQCRGRDAGCGDAKRVRGSYSDGRDIDTFIGLADPPPGPRFGPLGGALQGARGDGLGIGGGRTVWGQRRVAMRYPGFDEPLWAGRVVPVVLADQPQVVGVPPRMFGGEAADRPVVGDFLSVVGVLANCPAPHLRDRSLGGCTRQVDVDVDRRAIPSLSEQCAGADHDAGMSGQEVFGSQRHPGSGSEGAATAQHPQGGLGVEWLGGHEQAALGAEVDQLCCDRGRAGEGLAGHQKRVEGAVPPAVGRREHGGDQLGRTRLVAQRRTLQRRREGA